MESAISTIAEFESVEMVDKNERKDEGNDDVLYGVEEVPPLGLTIINSIQHFLLSFDGAIGMSIMIFGILCFDDAPDTNYYKAKIIGSFFVMAGSCAIVQTTFGIRLPTAEVISGAYFVPLTTMMTREQWSCPKRIVDFDAHNVTFDSNTTYLYQERDGSYVESTEVWQLRMREVQGGIIVMGIAQIVIGSTGAVGFAMRFIGPLTIAPTLILTSVALLNIAMEHASIFWGTSLFYLAMVILFQYLARFQLPFPGYDFKKKMFTTTKMPFFAMFPFLAALLLTWLLSYILTATNALTTDRSLRSYRARTDALPGVIEGSPWFSFPYPFQWGWPTFSAATIVGLIAALFVGMADSICDFYACAKVVKHPKIPSHALNRGIALEGLGILFHGLLGTGNATTTFASNTAGLQVSKVHSRRVIQGMSLIYIVIGFFTKFCSVFLTIPVTVIGGQICAVSAILMSIGVSTVAYADLSNMRNMFVFGFSVIMALVFEKWIRTNPTDIDVGVPEVNAVIRTFLGTGMLVSGLIAFILDNTVPGSPESRGILKWRKADLGIDQDDSSEHDPVYDLPFKTKQWKWTRFIPMCPLFMRKSTSSDD